MLDRWTLRASGEKKVVDSLPKVRKLYGIRMLREGVGGGGLKERLQNGISHDFNSII